MLDTIVSHINQDVNCTKLKHSKQLVIGMLLSNGRKTCLNMANECFISHDVLQKILASSATSIEELNSFLISMVKLYSNKKNKAYLIVDDSALRKQFASVLEGLGFVYDSIIEKEVKGYKLVVICWTNQEVTIPLAFRFWLNEDQAGASFKTKLELAQEVISELQGKIEFEAALLDGLYSSEDMMSFLEEKNIIYHTRLPKNRKVKQDRSSPAIKIGDHRSFRVTRNNRSASFDAYFGDKLRYITAEKRRKRYGKYETVYIVSNQKQPSSEAIFTYSIRWNIEKFFRTAKQTLGIADCQARSLQKQTVHILACFAAYAILESIKLSKKFNCPEDTARHLKMRKSNFQSLAITSLNQYFIN